MQVSSERKANRTGGVLAIVAGAVALVASLLVWVKIRLNLSQFGLGVVERSFAGKSSSDGKIVLGIGIVLIVIGLLTWMAKGRRAGIGLGVLAVLGGLVAGGFGLYDALTAKSQVIDKFLDAAANALAKSAGVSATQARAVYQQLVDQGLINVSVQIGLWLTVVAGALGVIGGLVHIVGGSKSAEPVGGIPAALAPSPDATLPMPPAPPPPPPPPPPAEFPQAQSGQGPEEGSPTVI